MRAAALAALLALPAAALAQPAPLASPSAQCQAAITAAERASGIPDRLMQAIAIMESGRRNGQGSTAPWPWTINVEGVGQVFETKAEAIAAVLAHKARGARSIDVGCMQVNLMHHADAFASLDEAFDPAANARYAARFLLQLMAQTGSWPKATAGYHSLTPDIGDDYARKVLAIWARPNLGQPGPVGPGPRQAASPSLFAAAGPPAAPPPTAMAGSSTARILPMAGAGGGITTGRGLDAYRAAPTRLAAIVLMRRG